MGSFVLFFFMFALCFGVRAWRPFASLHHRPIIKSTLAALSIFYGITNHADISLGAEYKTDDGTVAFTYPDDSGLQLSPKLLKTHEQEVFLKSETIKGFNVGITMDKVKIQNIKDFTTPKGLADKVVLVEKSKEGVFEADVVDAKEGSEAVAGIPAYEIEYKIDSSRGKNHYFVKATVFNSKLYVFTVQCKEDSAEEIQSKAKSILDSLVLQEAP